MDINEIVNTINTTQINGLQISKRNGILSSTWFLYKKDGFYFYFDINQKIEFIDRYKYSTDELINELRGSVYNIDLTIS